MSTWDEIGAELHALSTANGGRHEIYKPVIRIEVYEHDDQVRVQVGRCKSTDEVVIRKDVLSGRPYPEALLTALREARVEAEAPARGCSSHSEESES